jgi:hypothetical protein
MRYLSKTFSLFLIHLTIYSAACVALFGQDSRKDDIQFNAADPESSGNPWRLL